MQRVLTKLFALWLLSALFLPAGAQEAGFLNSPKGFGAQYRFAEADGIFHTATALIDIYGIPSSRCSSPGLRFNFSRQYIFKQLESRGVSFTLYAGPGLSAGVVRDHDKGRWFDLKSLISENPGFMLALSGDAGCRFGFGRRISLDLSFTADAGIHVRRNEDQPAYPATSLSVYNNGFLQALYPQFTILFDLR